MGRTDRAGKPTRLLRGLAGAALLLATCLATGAAAVPGGAALPGVVPAPQYFPPLERLPLDPPLRLSGSFGEYRPGHFHAGLDLATGGQVGRPVFAALPGGVVRVRASGVGYGRSVYLQADDGRLLVYGHLDAFDEPLASYVAAAQDSAGEYEQDLWPDPARFRVEAGRRLGWSGRSGTDAPHLHFEVRRGDVAYNPLLAGLSVEDSTPPVFRRVALVPVRSDGDDTWQRRPQVIDCTGNDTAVISGLERLVVEAVDARADGQLTMAPWRVLLETGGEQVECRFDSVSWAEGMSEVDFVYDRGRALPAGRHALVLGAPPGLRPRVLRARSPLALAAGALAVPVGGRPLAVRLLAQDVAGRAAAETLALAAAPAEPVRTAPPGTWVRATSPSAGGGRPGFSWAAGPGTFFEDWCAGVAELGSPEAPDELKPRSHVFALGPPLTPLRRPLRVEVHPSGPPRAGALSPSVGLYRDSGGGWEFLGSDTAQAHGGIGAGTRELGRFALFHDATAPRFQLLAPPRVVPAGFPSRWALEARVAEEGSGVAVRSSWFEVDGRRVPSEWDAVANTLRWKPLRAPASGRHEVEVVLTDRAGNVRRRHAGFVLD
jgi:hypothetical protein